MISLFRQPASEGLVSTAASLILSNYDLLGETMEATVLSGLGTGYVHYRLTDFNVPWSVRERFIEQVWFVALSGRPSLADRLMGFAVMAGMAAKLFSDGSIADPFAEFWTRHYSKLVDDPDESVYNHRVQTMVEVIDGMIAENSRNWKVGQ